MRDKSAETHFGNVACTVDDGWQVSGSWLECSWLGSASGFLCRCAIGWHVDDEMVAGGHGDGRSAIGGFRYGG